MSWTFEQTNPRAARRDPFEAEFFTGEGETREQHGRIDSFVREILQNSCDAGVSEQVKVVFSLRTGEEALKRSSADTYLNGLVDHLLALGVDLPEGDVDFLVIEDFGTRGLAGDPSRQTDPVDADGDQSFYWFWRNIGRSAKFGNNLGRWGLGKTVFPSGSQINAFFGLTVRECDGKSLLMGQAITKIHSMAGKEYAPEGFFHDIGKESATIQLPYDDPDVLAKFAGDFKLTRKNEPGLSVVVPYPRDLFRGDGGALRRDDVLRSIIVHFFVPIIKGKLVVELTCTGVPPVEVTRANIHEVAKTIEWSGGETDKKNAPPPFALAEWAIEQQSAGKLIQLDCAGEKVAPQWNESLFADGSLEKLRDKFQIGDRIALRSPVSIEFIDGSRKTSYFDVFLEADSDVPRSQDFYVRDGMTISKISMLGTARNVRGLVLVDDEVLSTLLGDAEGPAHCNWGESEERPDKKYTKWVSRLRFTKHSIKRLIELLSPPPEGLDENWLIDIFSVDDTTTTGTKKKKKKNRKPVDVDPDPPHKPPQLDVTKLDGNRGFRIKAGEDVPAAPFQVRVRAAYDTPRGNPFSHYSPFDFIFESGKSDPVKLEYSNCTIVNRGKGSFTFKVEKGTSFEVKATGFDRRRDLLVEASILEI
jgi:hypothetical protein